MVTTKLLPRIDLVGNVFSAANSGENSSRFVCCQVKTVLNELQYSINIKNGS
jgi:hypothetical protein